ncbi:MAG TPA: hypothetical protein VF017_04425 [Thermoanaerobaculia bacterium]|nr:hypothetical protein [Thermoanaerobaculia bacterium]
MRGRIEEQFAAHGVAKSDAEAILAETLAVLVWRWETIRNREAWLIAMIERKVRMLSARANRDPWDDDPFV